MINQPDSVLIIHIQSGIWNLSQHSIALLFGVTAVCYITDDIKVSIAGPILKSLEDY